MLYLLLTNIFSLNILALSVYEVGVPPIIATWADRFSRCCCRWFSWFLACPLTLSQVPVSQCLSRLLHTGHSSHPVSLPAVLQANCKWCCFAVSKGEGWRDTESTRATLSRWTASTDCHLGEVLTESRPRLHGAAISISDHTLDALLDHLRDSHLTTVLARWLINRSHNMKLAKVNISA